MLRAILIFCAFFATEVRADGGQTLGIGRLFTNDYLGDGRDRWQSGSYAISIVRGPLDWWGRPQPIGAVREYRLRSAVLASDGRGAAPGDRPYAGVLSVGWHSHFGAGNTRSSVGVDLTAVGPQTGISRFQRRAHDVLGMPEVRFTDRQLPNDLFFGATAETAELLPLGKVGTVRPFAEAQLGAEDLVRVGADVVFGRKIADEVLIRDVATGQLYQAATGYAAPGFSFTFGGDVAYVAESRYLPTERNVSLRETRGRLRLGAQWQGESGSRIFYGLTYLSPEFDGQGRGQVTGSVSLNFNF